MDKISYTQSLTTKFGTYRVSADQSAIRQVSLVNDKTKEVIIDNPSPLTQAAITQLKAYFSGKLTQFDLPLNQDGTPFQQQVWDLLLTIPYGETVSYADLAKSLSNPGAVRAVGAANGKNQIPIIIPCHRVIASSGKLQGYALGIELKRQLLDLERSKRPDFLF